MRKTSHVTAPRGVWTGDCKAFEGPVVKTDRKAVSMKQLRLVLMLALFGFAGLALAEDESGGWRTLYEERGVLVSTREEPGVDLPRLRGQTSLEAGVLHLLAILLDDEHSTEWAKGADETLVLRRIDQHSQLVYAHSRQPWPVKDRDLVMKRTVEVLEPGKAYRVQLVCVPEEHARVANVVRVRRCETTFMLRAIDASHTQIDYRVQADPDGHIPAWLIRKASRSIPADTLRGLAKQVKLTRGKYDQTMAQWAKAKR